MSSPFRVYVFGDQTYDIADLLSSVLRTREDATLQDFLERSSRALKLEIARLESKQQAGCPRFAKLLDLVPLWRARTLNPAVSQALTCITQLAVFLR